MECQTVRKGVDCFFWKKDTCTHKESTCLEIVEKCQGCGHITEIDGKSLCQRYPEPSIKWLFGICNMATHVQIEKPKVEEKMINPLKASKRMSRSR